MTIHYFKTLAIIIKNFKSQKLILIGWITVSLASLIIILIQIIMLCLRLIIIGNIVVLITLLWVNSLQFRLTSVNFAVNPDLIIIVLRTAIKSDWTYFFVGMEYWWLSWSLLGNLILQTRMLTKWICILSNINHIFSWVKRRWTANHTSTFIAAVFAAWRITILIY